MSAGEQEILREARRVLRKLASGKRLVMCDADRFAVTGTGALRNAMKVDRTTVDAFVARDWIRGSVKDGFTLSDAGRGWLKRAECDDALPFAAQHRVITRRKVQDENGLEREVEINELESPIAWLRHRGLIDAMQFEAGDRLRRDYTLAQLAPRLAADLESPVVDAGGKSPGEFSDMVLAAKQRFLLAMKAVGPGLSDLLFDVCCHLMRLEGVEREFGWPQRSAKVVLQIALDRLGEHYGLCVKAPARARMRSWAAAV
ncbi:MAG TPA: DUF6456 domain-containing protein [Rhizomicrobium sp.]|nr:DUF6456 domain-containing protein [Rhizomicrobium sp.]